MYRTVHVDNAGSGSTTGELLTQRRPVPTLGGRRMATSRTDPHRAITPGTQ